ncbi:protein phosphatase 2C 77 [Gossypium raimondii]|uniref:protein-serine/threonine phosphatase n=1 Tax=Gossypium raimondii TaxID=29730 RepID=A0A0D2S7E2_GOSRA|nr:protein phosphatase 2C 77 [Gossypium raimondii]KJB27199.1 hypothetical protein B456_004G284400 [Gossypium raimondii]KJB27200.1 hypothetical protein B456_004G284400 [Gossypium raimondii]KJB27201.1 hypothetical protein B456_004G284400 [Gossypium raimondii]MBA0584973.1 hypothetical protein [Gossypium raimondii]
MSKDLRTMSTRIDRAPYNLTAEKTSLLPNQPCEFTCGRIQGFHGAGLSNHQGGEGDVPVSFGVDHENSCPQSIAHRSNPKSSESFLEVSATLLGERNISDVQDVKRVAMDLAGDDNNRLNEYNPRSPESFLEVPQRKKMRKTESHCLFESNNIPLWGFTSICGRRIQMEDAVVAIPRFLQVPPRILNVESVSNQTSNISNLTADFYAVYDGHGGCQVANYCRERMHTALAEEIEMTKACILDGNIGYDWREQWQKAFLNCFVKVDTEIGGVHRGHVSETAGSTAVIAVVSPTHIIVANCGDSRAVLSRGKFPIPLSIDHKPDREDEQARIEAAGGKIIQWNGPRVSGVLAMSRSIGDKYLKPWIIPDPEVTFVSRANDDECLVLASDGLWDVLSNDEACEVARKRIGLWRKKYRDKSNGEGIDGAAQSAAEYLSRLALSKGSKDNISVIVVDLKAHTKFKNKT